MRTQLWEKVETLLAAVIFFLPDFNRWLRSFTESCLQRSEARGLYRQHGISPHPEDASNLSDILRLARKSGVFCVQFRAPEISEYVRSRK